MAPPKTTVHGPLNISGRMTMAELLGMLANAPSEGAINIELPGRPPNPLEDSAESVVMPGPRYAPPNIQAAQEIPYSPPTIIISAPPSDESPPASPLPPARQSAVPLAGNLLALPRHLSEGPADGEDVDKDA